MWLSTVELRSAGLDDAPVLAELSVELGYPSTEADCQRRLEPILGSSDHAVIVAVEAGCMVAWIHAFIAYRVESDPFAELGGLVVAATHRRRGIGRKLLSAVETWAHGRRVAKLRVRTRSDRSDAKVFYERSGFSETKHQRVLDKPLRSISPSRAS